MRTKLIFNKRVAATNIKIKEFYDRAGVSYDTLANQRYRRMLQRYARKELREASPILDVGCGTGTITSKLKGLKIGLDFSSRLVRIAKGRGLEVIIGDAENLPFIDNIFEAIVCSDVLEHLQTPVKAIKEFVRVLKPRCKVLITTPNHLWAPFIKFADALRLKFPEGEGCYIWPNALDKMLKEANFVITKKDGWIFTLGWPRQLSLEQVIIAMKNDKF